MSIYAKYFWAIPLREGLKKAIIIAFGSDPLTQLDQFLSTFGKKCILPFENPITLRKNFKKMVLDMQNVRHIAQNAGHTVQNDGPTMENVDRTTRNVGHNTLNVCQGPKGGLEELFFEPFPK